MEQLKTLLKNYVQTSLEIKNLKIQKQKIALDIKHQEIFLNDYQEQILQQMKDLGIAEDEINLGGNIVVRRTQVKKTKAISLKDVEEEFTRQNGNPIMFNQIINKLKEDHKTNAEVKTTLKLRVPSKK